MKYSKTAWDMPLVLIGGKEDEIKPPDVHGKKDKICSFDLAEQMKAGIKNSHIVAFENSGHSMFLVETQKFNEELIKFANK